MGNTHVIVGSGPTGQTTAKLLASYGEQVILINRSGSGEAIQGVKRMAIDANDQAALQQASANAAVIYNCVNPIYTSWVTDWPPIANSILNAAKKSGAVLVTLSNLYGYAPPTRPMVETDPLATTTVKGQVRVKMWQDALEAHNRGDVAVTEARASDFIGTVLGETSHMGSRVTVPLKAGKTVNILGNADVAHSWTAMNDVAATLVELGSNSNAWGKAWHVPTADPLTQREILERMGSMVGVDNVKIRTAPAALVTVMSLFQPMMRELKEMLYQFEQPFIVDSSAVTETFGLKPAPMEDSLRLTLGLT